jgi:hypothetical protein
MLIMTQRSTLFDILYELDGVEWLEFPLDRDSELNSRSYKDICQRMLSTGWVRRTTEHGAQRLFGGCPSLLQVNVRCYETTQSYSAPSRVAGAEPTISHAQLPTLDPVRPFPNMI